jgi:hypothetical protein
MIIWSHIVFTDKTQYVVVLWLGCRCCRLSVNTICGHIMIGLSLLSSISKYNMWSNYDWVVVVVVRQLTQYVVVLWLGCRCCRLSVNTICGRVMIGLSLLSSVSKHNMWSYYHWVDNNDNPMIIWSHIVFTDRRQQRQPNHKTITYCVNWRTTTTTTQS